VVIRVFFAVLVLCTLAVVAVILAVHFRVKRHLREQTTAAPQPGAAAGDTSAEVAVPSAVEGAASNTEETSTAPPS